MDFVEGNTRTPGRMRLYKVHELVDSGWGKGRGNEMKTGRKGKRNRRGNQGAEGKVAD